MAERLYVVDANSNGVLGIGARDVSQEKYDILTKQALQGRVGNVPLVFERISFQSRAGDMDFYGYNFWWSPAGNVLIGKIGRNTPFDVGAVKLVSSGERGLEILAHSLGLEK